MAKSKETIPEKFTSKANTERIEVIRQVVGGVLCYTCAIDCAIFTVLRSIAIEWSQVIEEMKQKTHQLMNYLTIQPNTTL